MATDVTRLLIQMVTGGSSQANWLNPNFTALSSTTDLLSTVADYVQIFGTIEGPIAQAAAASKLNTIAAQQAAMELEPGAAAEASALAGAGAGLAGGVIVVFFSAILVSVLNALGNQVQSEQSQLLEDLINALENLAPELVDPTLAAYWNGKLTTGALPLLWTAVAGDLDDLASEGTGGKDVKNDLPHSHSDAQRFIILLVDNPFGSEGFWVVPAEPAGDVPQSSPGPSLAGIEVWTWQSWYGQFPTRDTADGPPGNVADPVTMNPVLALGIQSYLLIHSLLYFVDQAQDPLPVFLQEHHGELTNYVVFTYQNYQKAVNGIVKTDLPSQDEILGAFWYQAQIAGVFAHPSTNPAQPTSQSWGAPVPLPPTQPGIAYSGNGWAWNSLYGASATYPQYGYYGNAQLDQAQRNLFTQAYIVSSVDYSNAVSQWQQAHVIDNVGSDTYVSIQGLQFWAIPWLENRLILGRMARWKAIYLLNGFDRVWSMLQSFQRAIGLTEVPTTMRLKQDDTIASGNWSARELCKVVIVTHKLLTGNQYVDADTEFAISWVPNLSSAGVYGHSVAGLLQFLYNVANGNWGGPPEQVADQSPPRPLSFRSLLASAAM